MNDYTQHIGILSLDLHIPAAQSLKEKRKVLKSLKDRVRSKFNVSIAELDGHDKWQIATCGIAMIGNDQRYLDGCLQNIVSFVGTCRGLDIRDYEITFL